MRTRRRGAVCARVRVSVVTNKQGNFLKTKARGFQDEQTEYPQTDSLASIRPRFRMSCQMAASKSWKIFYNGLKTAFLQEQSKSVKRDVVCQLPPEAGHPPYIAARLQNPAFGMKDVSRHWWNILDKALCCYGLVPTRAERCCYELYSVQSRERTWKRNNCTHRHDAVFEKMLDPVAGSPATGKSVAGINYFLWVIFRNRWNRNGRTSLRQIEGFPRVFRRLE